jgi:hypothetical protein
MYRVHMEQRGGRGRTVKASLNRNSLFMSHSNQHVTAFSYVLLLLFQNGCMVKVNFKPNNYTGDVDTIGLNVGSIRFSYTAVINVFFI